MNKTPPNRELAADLAKELLDFTDGLRRKLGAQDPEGRTLSLGITMFFGMVLATVKELEDRETMAGAAVGFFPEDRCGGLFPEDRCGGLFPEDRCGGLFPEDR